ncbi:MAG: hypothetical protein HOW73_44435, partial [Polyangiaceae bacterium]|nr:hypothetical protein [Polyangiaceae bacterium]
NANGAGGAGGPGGSADGGAGGGDGGAPVALKGWELDASNVGLARVGLICDELPLYDGGTKPAAGTVVSEQRIESGIDLSNGDIVIERSCIRPASIGAGLPILTTTNYDACTDAGCPVASSMVTIRDCDIDGSALDDYESAFSTAFIGVGTLQRNYIHGMGSGIAIFNSGDSLDATIEGNYVTGLTAYGDPAGDGNHSDGFTVRDFDTQSTPDRRLVVQNNRIDCSSGNDTGAFFIQTYGGDIDQVKIEGNLLEGGGYQLVLSAGFGNAYGANMSAVDNRLSGTGYGPGYVADPPGWAAWEENYLHDASQPDAKGEPIDEP